MDDCLIHYEPGSLDGAAQPVDIDYDFHYQQDPMRQRKGVADRDQLIPRAETARSAKSSPSLISACGAAPLRLEMLGACVHSLRVRLSLAALVSSVPLPASADAEPETVPAAQTEATPPAAAVVEPPVLDTAVEAAYPAEALETRTEGQVVLRLSIDAEGAVLQADVVEPAGHGFDEAARAAALQFRFQPARRGGNPIASRILYRYVFHLPVQQPTDPTAEPAKPALTAPAVATTTRSETSDTPAASRQTAAPSVTEVHVKGQSAAEQLRGSAESVKVIDATLAKRQSADIGELLARTEGVAVQRSGGLGSQTRLSIHGLTDDQIRFFVDGVPLEFSGFGLGVASVPLHWVDRIDIYRGVVPTSFGADALGGAINLVTDQSLQGRSAAASYTAGAFDTHQLALNARTAHDASGFMARVGGFFDTTKNDYVVHADVGDRSGSITKRAVRRFHDAYAGGGAMLEAGFVRRPWAKRLLLRLFATHFDKELQHNIDMSVPYGEVTYGQGAAGGTLVYEQPRLAGTRLGITALAGYSRRTLWFEDRSRFGYDWYGNPTVERQPDSAESQRWATSVTQWEHRILGRVTLAYRPLPQHRLLLTLAPDLAQRTGAEALRLMRERLDPLTSERRIFQFIGGLEYQLRDGSDRIDNRVFVKYYLYRPAIDLVQTMQNSIVHLEDTKHRVGAGDMLRVRLTDALSVKAAYEYAIRVPRSDEVFGDGVLVLPNPELSPEQSHNANLGALFEQQWTGHSLLALEVTGFMRRTQDMISRLVASDRVHAIHQNVFDVHTYGVDGMLRWVSPGQWLTLQGNATWMDQRNGSKVGPFAPFDGARVPNRPWHFANASAVVRIPYLGAANASLALSWVSRYVGYYLAGWPAGASGGTTFRVPPQLMHSASFVYTVRGGQTIDLALDLTNITDARVYDVWGVQRPGRAAYFKVTVCLDCSI